MNELEEIKKYIKNFVNESNQLENKITEIEKERINLAYVRNQKKTNNQDNNTTEINALGQKISALGNKSQEIQNKLDCKFNEIKSQVNLAIDRLVADGIREICRINEEKQNIIKDRQNEIQKIKEVDENINKIEEEIAKFATIKRNFKNRNYTNIFCQQPEGTKALPLIEEFQIEENEPIEYIQIEQFEPVERIEIGEVEIEQWNELEEPKIAMQQTETDKIEILARAIVEEIIAEQTKDLNILNNEQKKIPYVCQNNNIENNKKVKKEISLLNIIAKIEDREIVYKAQINNGDEIKVYPTLEVKNILLNDKEYRDEIKEYITNYASKKEWEIDKSVIKKIDPTVCEILDRYAKKYNQDINTLIYNYLMSFSKDTESVTDYIVPITYNVPYLKNTNLCTKEKTVITKICKNACKAKNVNVIRIPTGFARVKYFLKSLISFNSIKALQEGKY